jgi:hypothetical protein
VTGDDARPQDQAVTRTFTVEQANRMLPLVQRIVADIVKRYAQWRDEVRAFEFAAAASRADLPDERAQVLQSQARTSAEEIEHFVKELADLGVRVKGFDVGLVDFPSEIDGRIVYLCWKLGEPSVQFWHEIDAGFAGRRPLSPLPVG